MKTRNYINPAAACLVAALCTCIALASCGKDDNNDPGNEVPGNEVPGSDIEYDAVIDLSKQTEINDDRTYLLTGTKQDVQYLVQIHGGSPTIILKDADIRGTNPIGISGNGTTTIKVVGKNQIISYNDPAISVEETATVRIIGDGRDKSQLTAKVLSDGSDNYPAIGNGSECGDISLSDITLIAEGSSALMRSSAAIGTGGNLGFDPNERVDYRKCGSITITDCHVEAKAYGGAAAIGFGYCVGNNADAVHEMGDFIDIKNSTIKSTVEKGPNGLWPAHIGGSANGVGKYTVGDIRIIFPAGMNGTEFFEHFNRSGNDEDAVVGYLNERNAGGLVRTPNIGWRGGIFQNAVILWSDVPDLK